VIHDPGENATGNDRTERLLHFEKCLTSFTCRQRLGYPSAKGKAKFPVSVVNEKLHTKAVCMKSTTSHLFALGLVLLMFLAFTAARLHGASTLNVDYPIEYTNNNYKTSEESTGSGVTWWPGQSKYLLLDNTIGNYTGGSGPRLLEFNTSHVQTREIVLLGFKDPEDIHWISANSFVISQEYNSSTGSSDELVVINIPTTGNSVNITTATRRLSLAGFMSTTSNKGIEACAVIGSDIYFTTENAPIGGSAPPWSVWKVPNSGSSGPVTPTVAFALSPFASVAQDIAGMASDGTHLWLLSELGDGSGPKGRILKVTTTGTLLADYEMPPFSSINWAQAEGIELFVNPIDNVFKILLTGEDPSASGTDFMRLTQQTVSIAANDPSAAEPEGATTFPGQFTVTRNVNPSVSLVVSISTAGSTATSGSDYTSVGSTVTIPANAFSTTINVSPINDAAYEKDESVQVTVSANGVYAPITPASATVTIQSVFELASAWSGLGVNDHGQAVSVVGRHNPDGSVAQTYSFSPYGINNAGDVAGWDFTSGYAEVGGVTYPLGQHNGYETIGTGINVQGTVVGNTFVGYSSVGEPLYWPFAGWGFNGPNGIGHGGVVDINDSGDMVASEYGISISPLTGYFLPAPAGWGRIGQGINNAGKITGFHTFLSTGRRVGVLWTPLATTPRTYSYVQLTTLPAGASGSADCIPFKINSSDVIVGTIVEPASTPQAAIWQGSAWAFLDDVIGDANWTFLNANDISNNGHIVGEAYHNSSYCGYLIRPQRQLLGWPPGGCPLAHCRPGTELSVSSQRKKGDFRT